MSNWPEAFLWQENNSLNEYAQTYTNSNRSSILFTSYTYAPH